MKFENLKKKKFKKETLSKVETSKIHGGTKSTTNSSGTFYDTFDDTKSPNGSYPAADVHIGKPVRNLGFA